MAKANDIATKKFVKEELRRTEGRIDAKVGRAVDDLKEWTEEKLDETFLKYKDQTMIKLDEIVDMLQKDDQERTTLSYQVSGHTDQLENHKKRIEKLEKTSPVAPAP